MANTHKTKAEILQELESIKGLLLEEEEDIPLLHSEMYDNIQPATPGAGIQPPHPALPGQGSLFEDSQANKTSSSKNIPPISIPPSKTVTNTNIDRTPSKPSGENPFLPQHIRERLHGNNPPPLFEYEAAQKIATATKQTPYKTNTSRQQLIEDVINSLIPQIETELRHRLFAMSPEDLEQLLIDTDD
jgi:hypothetical protein